VVENTVVGVYNPTKGTYTWLAVNAIPQFNQDTNTPVGGYSVFEDITERKYAEESLKFLYKATSLLNASIDYEAMLKTVARLAVPKLADWCAIDMLEADGSLRRLVVEHIDPEKISLAHELARRLPTDMNAATGVPHVVRTGQPEFTFVVTDEMIETSIAALTAIDPDIADLIRSLDIRSSMIVPLMARERCLGAITFVAAESGRHFGPADLALAQELARHAGLSIDSALLFYQTQQAKDELETRVNERTAQLEASLKELEAFSYSVSHDLRAPLRTIDGFSRAILEDYAPKLDEEGQSYLNRIRAATHQMAQLIDDLLKLSRVTRSDMHMEEVNLSAMAREIAANLQSAQPERTAAFTIEDKMIVRGDQRLLHVVMTNLLDNAWKFSEKQPDVEINVGVTERDGKKAYFVRDNGAGFDMAYAHKLFGAFQRLHSDTEFSGSGIGLATVQRVIRRHGGQVWAEGEVGHGAGFYFTLS
jgi:signal transduction histidine kinase